MQITVLHLYVVLQSQPRTLTSASGETNTAQHCAHCRLHARGVQTLHVVSYRHARAGVSDARANLSITCLLCTAIKGKTQLLFHSTFGSFGRQASQ